MKYLVSEFDDDNNWIRSIEIAEGYMDQLPASFYRVEMIVRGQFACLYQKDNPRA